MMDSRSQSRREISVDSSFNQQHEADFCDTRSNHSSDIEGDASNKKKTRGPTCMRNIWGETRKRIYVPFNKFGQPIGKKSTSELAHFLGTVARNGSYAPLNIVSWTQMPNDKKKDMWTLVQKKFDIPHSEENWIIRSIGKKWRSWKTTVKRGYYDSSLSIEEQIRSVPDDRLVDSQWAALVKRWHSEEAKNEELGHYPTRCELFMWCYSTKDGTPSSEISGQAMASMRDMMQQEPEDSQHINIHEDVFSKVMGKEKHGRVRMLGLGVCPSDISGAVPSRSASNRMSIEYKTSLDKVTGQYNEVRSELEKVTGKYDAVSNELQAVKAMLMQGGVHAGNHQVHSNVVSTSVRDSTRSQARDHQPLRVRSLVDLKSIMDPTQTIAKGVIRNMDPLAKVGGEPLGPNWYEVHVNILVKFGEYLIRPYEHFKTIGDVIGATIAWPASLVKEDFDF